MNRRETFKLFAAGTVSLLGLKGLAEAFSRPKPGFIGAATLHVPEAELGMSEPVAVNQFVMGEQAHWPMDDLTTEQRAWYDQLSRRIQTAGDLSTVRMPDYPEAQVVATKIDGRWVDTSDWPPEKVRELCQPRPLRRRHV